MFSVIVVRLTEVVQPAVESRDVAPVVLAYAVCHAFTETVQDEVPPVVSCDEPPANTAVLRS